MSHLCTAGERSEEGHEKWIRNGTVVTASDTYQADVLIDGEKVVAIGSDLQATDAEVIDATGYYLLPGGIDPHTHLDMPFGGTVTSDNFFTGTKPPHSAGRRASWTFA